MKIRSILATLLLLMAGLQAAQAQVMKIWRDGKYDSYDVSIVDSVQYVESVYEWVDLGLPSGTLWATCNIGANSPEEYGYYFSWGETETKSLFDWSTYKLLNEGETSWTQINKYTFADGQTEGCWYNGTSFIGDNNTRLLPADDAATVNWGSKWSMPSKEQFEELINSDYTTTEWTTQNGVNGYKITSVSNSKSIFMPVAGVYYGSYLDESLGAYWSCELSTDYCNRANYLSFNSSHIYLTDFSRALGHSIRPVQVKEAVHVQEITLNEEYVCLYSYKEPKTVKLVATVLPENADNKAVKWESSNTRMTVVSKDGVVSILPDNYLWEEGECIITCSALDGSGVKATCIVRVDHSGSAL